MAVPDALEAITRQTGLRFLYLRESLPSTSRVSVDANQMTVAAVLTDVLLDTGLDVELTGADEATLITRGTAPHAPPRHQQQAGSITGTVRDSVTGQRLADVVVSLQGTGLRTTTDRDGKLGLNAVPVGRHMLVARRLSYRPLTSTVVIVADSTVTLNLLLQPAATRLEQVVTTATGDQHLVELGNSIGTIAADSVVNRSPVTDLADVLTARVPGVQVYTSGGLVGASPLINIRGQNSVLLSNQPLLVVDGARVSNSGASTLPGDNLGVFGTSTGRFNDLVPEDIESIEIVKGPSAATLYGTDAANGVIVVTTKRGAQGGQRWSLYSEQGVSALDRSRFPDNNYTGWGHTLDSTNTLTNGCDLQSVANGQCKQDSVTRYSPLRDPSTTPIGVGRRETYGAQVSGGRDTRYFVSGTYQGEVGYLKLPQVDRQTALQERGGIGIAGDEQHPNGYDKVGIRSNLITPLGRTADLSVSAAYLYDQSHLPTGDVLAQGLAGAGYRDTTSYGYLFGRRPLYAFLLHNRETTDHFTGSATGNWRSVGWLAARAIAGLDYAGTNQDLLERNEPFFGTGVRTTGKGQLYQYTADVSATGTGHVTSGLTSRTSVGAQYTRTLNLQTSATATNLAPGGQVVGAGAQQLATESNVETIVAGAYVQEEVTLNDRLYLTVAGRADGAGAFGASFQTATYPKASASWLVSSEPFWPRVPGLSSLRLRSAIGESGVQPPPAAALASVSLQPTFVDGAPITAAFIVPGQLRLRPERQREFEGGIDVDALASRVHLEATYYYKRSSDALILRRLPLDAGGRSTYLNVGSVRNSGYEALLSADLLATQPVAWTVDLNGSVNNNRLLHLAPGVAPNYVGFGVPGYATGRPLFSYFENAYHYADANHDGIIEPGEVTIDTNFTYIGQSYPRTQLTLGTTVALFRRALSLRVQFDHRGGFVLPNGAAVERCAVDHCRANIDPHSSLADQAAAVALNQTFTYAGYYSDATFTRLREVAVTYAASPTIARAVHSRSLVLTLSARNLALWTRYKGVDPETQEYRGALGAFGAFVDNGGTPPPQYWLARVSLGL